MWVSFCQADVIRPSLDERRAFRYYHAPLVCAGGLPLWFFGPNVLRWVMYGFIDKVWGWRQPQAFDRLTELIAIYGMTARARRDVDTRKKRMKNVAQNRTDLRAEAQEIQYAETADGKTVPEPTPVVRPPLEPLDDADAAYPDFPPSRECACGGQLDRVGRGMPPITDSWMLIGTKCTRCGKEQTYRRRRPL
jgi:hypothetical protein